MILVLALVSTFRAPLACQGKGVCAQDSVFVKTYMEMLDSVRENVSSEAPCEAPRLFLPMTFYRDVVSGFFSLHQQPSVTDHYLMRLYMSHPSWVGQTASRLARSASSSPAITTPVVVVPELTGKTAAEEPEVQVEPVAVLVRKPNFWTVKGEYNLQFLQNYISGNWYKGGESNYAMMASLVMEANYNNKQKVKWDNKLEMKLGLQANRTDSLHAYTTNEDLLRYTGKLGLQATKKWYYTLQVVAWSQFMHNYKSNDAKLYSHFLAPLNVNVSVGMDYSVDWCNHRLKGNFHLAPFAYNLKYTRLLELCSRLGIDEGHHAKNDFGSQFTIDLEWKFSDAVKWKTRMYGYSTFERAELEWENTFTFQFSKWISAQLFVYPRFDDGVGRDDHHGYWQFKEFASLGFSYSF